MIENASETAERQPSDSRLLALPTRVITYAWGTKYIRELLSLTLPALLAPGNLPHLAAAVPCEMVILTERRFFSRFLTDAAVVRIQEFCSVRFVALDDLVSDPDKYGIALTHVLHRGFADLGPAVTDNWLIFLNADFVLADGSLRTLLGRLAAGERLVAAPSYCVNSEAAVPELLRRIDPHTRSLSLPPREMAALVLRHRHNTIRGKTINQSLFSIRYMDQFYWQLDVDTLLGHQMPIAIAGMRPERYLVAPNAYWDHGLMKEFVPETPVCVIGDSDEFLMLELRGQAVAQDQLRLGWPDPAEIARNTLSFMTAYQREMAQHPLTLHSRDLPTGVDEARRRLRAFVDSVLAMMPSELPSHLDHPQWNYHWPGLIKTRHDYLSKQLGQATETDEPPAELSELDRAWWKLDGLKKSYERRRTQLVELHQHQRAAVSALQDRLEWAISEEREALREKLVTELAKAGLDSLRSEPGRGRILAGLAGNSEDVCPIGQNAPWSSLLQDSADAWPSWYREAEARREGIAALLAWVDRHYETRLGMLDLEFETTIRELQAEYDRTVERRVRSAAIPCVSVRTGPPPAEAFAGEGLIEHIGRPVYRRVFGRVPRNKKLHPYRAPLHRLIEIVERAERQGANILVLVGNGGIADRLAATLSGRRAEVSLGEALQGNLAAAFNHAREIDLCVCCLEPSELGLFPDIVRSVIACMREDGRIVAFCPNLDLQPLPIDDPKLLSGLSDLPGAVQICYSGSPQSARVIRRFRKVLAMSHRRRSHALARIAAALLALSPGSLAASHREASRSDDRASRPPDYCSSMTIEVTI